MTTDVRGRTDRPAFDPTAIHYGMSEATHLHLQLLAATLNGLSVLSDKGLADMGSDFADTHAGPIFWLLADYTTRLLADMDEVHPQRRAA